MAPDLAGTLSFDLRYENGRIADLDISSTRPYYAARVLHGKPVEKVTAVVPLLYNLCAGAQQVAAIQAAEQALGVSTDALVHSLRQVLVVAESARELAWRLTKDWLENHNPAHIATLKRWYDQLFKSLLPLMRVGAESPSVVADIKAAATELEQWFAQSFGSRADIERQFEQPEASSPIGAVVLDLNHQFGAIELKPGCIPLPEIDLPPLLDAFRSNDQDAFVRQPDWQGCCRETSVWTRRVNDPLILSAGAAGHHPLSLRFLAMVLELSQIPARLRQLLEQTHSESRCKGPLAGEGVGIVEAARGRLVHYVQLEGEQVSNYQIVAPTEWNFHPAGSVSAMLKGVEVPVSQVEALARQTILAVDPCIGFEINLEVVPHA